MRKNPQQIPCYMLQDTIMIKNDNNKKTYCKYYSLMRNFKSFPAEDEWEKKTLAVIISI